MIFNILNPSDSYNISLNDLASYKVTLNKLKEPIVHLQSSIGATIRYQKDFIRANREIYSIWGL